MNKSLRVISGNQVQQVLKDQEVAVVDIIQAAYVAHAQGQTSVPFSTFLRFPERPKDRIIGLPAYVAGDEPVAGIKWVSSFPDNITKGVERASAIVVLNNMDNGRPYCVLEGSLINLSRTAASAALAAKLLLPQPCKTLTLIGCGPINRTIARYVSRAVPGISTIRLYDIDVKRATKLAHNLEADLSVKTTVVADMPSAIRGQALISIATNAASPSITDPTIFAPNSLILHISLRDISPELILSTRNVVDDIDHVNRENTSIYLASQQSGETKFIDATIGEIAGGLKHLRKSSAPIVYSPFGLGVLDVNLSQYIYQQAVKIGLGADIDGFFIN